MQQGQGSCQASALDTGRGGQASPRMSHHPPLWRCPVSGEERTSSKAARCESFLITHEGRDQDECHANERGVGVGGCHLKSVTRAGPPP